MNEIIFELLDFANDDSGEECVIGNKKGRSELRPYK